MTDPWASPPAGAPAPLPPPPPDARPRWGEPPPAQPARAPRAGGAVSVVALVLGLVALLTCWLVLPGLGLGLAAVICGAVGTARSRRVAQRADGLAIAGLVLGVLAVIGASAMVALLYDEFADHQSCLVRSVSVAADEACDEQLMQDLREQLGA